MNSHSKGWNMDHLRYNPNTGWIALFQGEKKEIEIFVEPREAGTVPNQFVAGIGSPNGVQIVKYLISPRSSYATRGQGDGPPATTGDILFYWPNCEQEDVTPTAGQGECISITNN